MLPNVSDSNRSWLSRSHFCFAGTGEATHVRCTGLRRSTSLGRSKSAASVGKLDDRFTKVTRACAPVRTQEGVQEPHLAPVFKLRDHSETQMHNAVGAATSRQHQLPGLPMPPAGLRPIPRKAPGGAKLPDASCGLSDAPERLLAGGLPGPSPEAPKASDLPHDADGLLDGASCRGRCSRPI